MYISLKDCLSVRGRQVNFPRMHMELDVEDRLKGSWSSAENDKIENQPYQ